MRKTSHRSGVYYIRNTVNDKMYIGSAIRSVRSRALAHRRELVRGVHENSHLQGAWNKYGAAAFKFSALEYCEPGKCREREQFWIDAFKTTDGDRGYNLCPTAGSWLGCKHSEETKARYREQRKGYHPVEATAAAAEVNRGRERPPEVRAKIAAGNAGKPKSEEHVVRLKETHWSKRPDAAEIAARIVENRPQTLTEEHRAKIAEGGRRRWAAYREKKARELETSDDNP